MVDRGTLDSTLGTAVLQSAPVGMAVIDPEGTILWANSAYFTTTGRDQGIVGKNFHQILEDDGSWSTSIGEAVDRALRTGVPATYRSVRARYRHQTGGVYLDVDVHPLAPSGGKVGHVVLMIRDVTDRVDERATGAALLRILPDFDQRDAAHRREWADGRRESRVRAHLRLLP